MVEQTDLYYLLNPRCTAVTGSPQAVLTSVSIAVCRWTWRAAAAHGIKCIELRVWLTLCSARHSVARNTVATTTVLSCAPQRAHSIAPNISVRYQPVPLQELGEGLQRDIKPRIQA